MTDLATLNELSPIELAAIGRAMGDAGIGLTGDLTADRIVGGRSNLTFRVTDGQGQWILRMPPRAGRTPSAHDVAREYRVTAALAGTDVPVARPILLCENESVIGSPFTVAEFVGGATIQSRDLLDDLDDEVVEVVVDRLVATLAALHRVDYAAVGLESFARPDAYAQRQVARWSRQWKLVGPDALHPLAEALIRRLSSDTPEQRRTSIVHGDYRIDNTILDLRESAPRVAAVVDWELSTLGDPIADVAMMCAYRHPAFDLIVGEAGAWTSPRLPEPDELAAAYEAAGGAELVDWSLHLGLAYFKIAVIAAGIDHRRRSGGARGRGFDTAGESVAVYLELARQTMRGRA